MQRSSLFLLSLRYLWCGPKGYSCMLYGSASGILGDTRLAT